MHFSLLLYWRVYIFHDSSTLLVDSKLVHVGYAQEGEDLLIVAMPVEK